MAFVPAEPKTKQKASSRLTGAQKLRELIAKPNSIVVAPGVYDGLTARLALAAQFDCLYMTGAGTSMSRLGMPDLGLATFSDMLENVSMICSLSPGTPVIADADTGYGGPIAVHRTVTAYARAGVAALHLEDQVQTKRCGHLMGKQLVDREAFYARLRAAVAAREASGTDMMIFARTDARATEGGLAEAIERLKGACQCGVDGLFLEAPETLEEAKKACQVFKGVPMLLNMVPEGKTPNCTVDEAKESGYKVMIFPTICLEHVISSVTEGLGRLKATGGMEESPGMGGVRKGFLLCGLQECLDIDREAGGKDYEDT